MYGDVSGSWVKRETRLCPDNQGRSARRTHEIIAAAFNSPLQLKAVEGSNILKFEGNRGTRRFIGRMGRLFGLVSVLKCKHERGLTLVFY